MDFRHEHISEKHFVGFEKCNAGDRLKRVVGKVSQLHSLA